MCVCMWANFMYCNYDYRTICWTPNPFIIYVHTIFTKKEHGNGEINYNWMREREREMEEKLINL